MSDNSLLPSATTATRALVFGASGYVGTNLVPHLLTLGLRVRAAARQRKVLEDRHWPAVECVAADALDPGSLPVALADVDIAFYLVHSMSAGDDFGQLDVTAATNFAEAAAAAGVQRIVYLGGLIPHNPGSEHLRSRFETGEVLRRGNVPVTEIRAGMIIGPGSAAFEVMRDLVNYLPLMVTPRWVSSRSPPIALDDLLIYLSGVALHPDAGGRIFDAAGPEQLSYAELMRTLGQQLDRRFLLLPVPVLTPRLSSYWLRLITSVPVNVARALIDGLRHDVAADDTELRALVPQRLQGVEEAIATALRSEREHDVPARWVEGSMLCRNYEPRYAYYAKRAGGSCHSALPAQQLWPVLCTFGHEQDYFALNALWWLRNAADWLVGGPGLRRGRRHPSELQLGDVIDAWRVVGLEPNRRLTLLMEMKTPGAGVLEFELLPTADGTEVRATAYFHPAGVWGLLYWYPLIPAHSVIFKAMTGEVCRRAAKLDGASIIGDSMDKPGQ